MVPSLGLKRRFAGMAAEGPRSASATGPHRQCRPWCLAWRAEIKISTIKATSVNLVRDAWAEKAIFRIRVGPGREHIQPFLI